MKSTLQLVLTLLLFSFGSIASAQQLNYGEDLVATISTTGETHTYTFNGNEGDLIKIRMRGVTNGVDACFILSDPSGGMLHESCDQGGISQISNILLSSSGTYTIEASDQNNNDIGEYGISLEILNNSSTAVPVSCSEDINATLSVLAEVDMYAIALNQGEALKVQMRSELSNVECQLELISPEGEVIATEITNTGLALLESTVVPTTGTYLVAAYDKNGNDTGNYGLSFQKIGLTSCTAQLECNANIPASLSSFAQMDAYSVSTNAGDLISIRMRDTDGSLEPQLELYNKNGTLLESITDHDNASLEYMTSQGGTYYIIASDSKGNDRGTYTLSYQNTSAEACATQLECGNMTLEAEFTTNGEIHVYKVEAEEQEIIDIQMRCNLNGVDSYLKLYDPAGTLIASDYANGAMASILGFEIPQSGIYTLTAEDRNGNDLGDYGISVQRVYKKVCSENVSCDSRNLSGNISQFAEMDVFTFDGTAGQLATIVMTEVDIALEPMMRLYGPEGELLLEDAKSFHVDFTQYALPLDGQYTIVASDKNGNDTGAYELFFTLDNTDGTSICCGTVGTSCDDGDPTTFNDVEDGECNCIGTLCPEENTQCKMCPEDLVLNCSEIGTPSDSERLSKWLAADLDPVICTVQNFSNDYDAALFEDICSAEQIGEEVSQLVTFKWTDLCGEDIICTALLTIVNDNCLPIGTTCDDGNPLTENDVEDGNCRCEGTEIPEECTELNVDEWLPTSYGGWGADRGAIYAIENNKGVRLVNNAWKAVDFEYEITADTKLEFEFMSTAQAEIHAIGFDKDNSSSSRYTFQLYGTQQYGIQDFRDYTEVGTYKKYIIPVGEYYTGSFSKLFFVMDDDILPKDGDSHFKNIRVYDGECTNQVINLAGCGSGSLTREVWENVNGSSTADLDWTTSPDRSELLTSFEAPSNVGDNYASRLSGYLCAPIDGEYTFFIAADDEAELWISSDESPSNIEKIATVIGWTAPRQWDKYDTQNSGQIYLEADKSYYIEARHKQGGGADHLAVGWEMPNHLEEKPISGSRLSPFSGNRMQRVVLGKNVLQRAEPTPQIVGELDFSVFPNPASEQIVLEVQAYQGKNTTIQLTNSFGQVIYHKNWNRLTQENININLNNLNILSGIYTVAIISNNSIKSKVVKVLK